ncbi:hypothetical protein A3F27_03645 [Candidatus Kaiserbacteria bacterium RIFCSPHIGHO2_12_FULL_53_13]|uniref:Peptidase S74 domain-containing protein n=1 Tax=Candidatus Kaiserbacteria bacterium RIFCSPHIGHO2_12_FULL_53_13 TaxID=1798502 RepID=A0A1F6E9Y2_9BACT|nr:MAG: hypothetical protein A3F27_03645 [Candidatus Kaiserbacteria bacterium RIFCSPHIGHO2_12_FULL_53_13]
MVAYRGGNTFVEAVVGTVSNTTITFGTPVALNAVASSYVSVAALDSTHFVVAYQNNSTNFANAVVSTVSGTTITAGTPTALNAVGSPHTSVAALDSTHFAVGYRNSSTTFVNAVVSTVSAGTTITPGTSVALNDSDSIQTSTAALDSTHFVVGYRNDSTTFINAVVSTVSAGTTITPGTFTALNSDASDYISAAALDSTHFAVGYRNTSTTFASAVVSSVSGTTITAGTPVALNAVNSTYTSTAALDSTHFAVVYNGSSGFANAIVSSVSGTTITAGTAAVLNAVASTYISAVALNSTHFAVGYRNGSTTYANTLVAKSSTTNVLGMATGAASAGGTVTIATNGIVSGLSGFTAGSTYYFSGASGLSTTSSSYKVGLALSASSLLLNSGDGAGTDQFFGDMIFSNNFRITESQVSPQALIFKNQLNHQILSLDERGDLTLPGVLTAARFQTAGSAFTIAESGNVGIGTENPSAKLTINGTDMASSTFAALDMSGKTSFVVSGEGNIGIGTSTPAARLDVTGTFGSPNDLFSVSSTTAAGTLSSLFKIQSNGNVGIGTTSPDMLLSVGNAEFAGSVAHFENSSGSCYIDPSTSGLSCSSDLRLKANINPVAASSGLVAVMQLNPVTYNWNKEATSSPTHTGLIAQEVREVYPDLVSEAPDGYLTLNYAGLTPYLVKAIQEQQAQIDALMSASSTSATSTSSWTPDSITAFILDMLKSLGIVIEQGIAHFTDLFATHLVATNLTVGSAEHPTGITMYDRATNAPYCFAIENGVATTTPGACADVVSGQSTVNISQITDNSNASSSPSTADSQPSTASSVPIISINGNNPANLTVGDVYGDLGAIITGPTTEDTNLGIHTFLNGVEMQLIQLDTSVAGTHVIDYVVTNAAGTATSTRTVIVADPFSSQTATSTDTTTSTTDTTSITTTDTTTATSTDTSTATSTTP